MIISQKDFGMEYHSKESYKFHMLYESFKLMYQMACPVFILLSIILIDNYLYLFFMLMGLVFWLLSVKMRSLRNIHKCASDLFKIDYFKMFK
jgi:hypothetical protein